jgi:hypothetical protein
MRGDLNPQAMTTLKAGCPSCGAPMEIIDRFTLFGVPAPVEHVKVRCVAGHWYTTPTDWLVSAGRGSRRRAAFQLGGGDDHRRSVSPFLTATRQVTRPSAGPGEGS